jgi:hypothetical protein
VPIVAPEHWLDAPENQDFPAAESYLSLLVGPGAAARLVTALQEQRTLEYFAAKDILRASGLPLLKIDDSEVAADMDKVKHDKKLSRARRASGSRPAGRRPDALQQIQNPPRPPPAHLPSMPARRSPRAADPPRLQYRPDQ